MMTRPLAPDLRPVDARFSSGPTKKRPGWTLHALEGALLGRSHRSKPGKSKLKEAIDRTRALLGVPADFKIAIVPASDTGAVEMALWSMLGPRVVDVFAWESFGEEWVTDAVDQLKLFGCRVHVGRPYGVLPDLSLARAEADIVVYTERYDVGSQDSELRLDSRESGGPHLQRCNQRRVCAADRLEQVRRRYHFSLAEGVGWRGGAWHVDSVAAGGGATGELCAPSPATEDFPNDEEGEVGRGVVRGSDYQHPVTAGGGGLPSMR